MIGPRPDRFAVALTVPAAAPVPAPDEDSFVSDGHTLLVRPLRAGDAARLVAFHEALSFDTIYHRFFGIHPHRSEHEAQHFCELDGRERFALAAVDNDRIVGVARLESVAPPGTAEVAFVLADTYQHKGLGVRMARLLLGAAVERGINRIVADTMADNDPMIHLLSNAGFPCVLTHHDHLVHVECDLSADR
jgi:RimJ/RimL family protein N-acetyltransferase